MSLVFNIFATSAPSPAGTYYAHVLTATPSGAETTVNGLTIASASGYAPIDLTISTAVSGTTTQWSFTEIVWATTEWTVALVGVVIVRQVGGIKNSAVDQPLAFFPFENAAHAEIVLTPGIFGIRFNSSASFAIGVDPANQYSAGAFGTQPIPQDLITILASNNFGRYTPASALTANQFYSSLSGVAFQPNPLCYWLGNKLMTRDLTDRHDIAYSNVTFPALGGDRLGFNTAATFNGNGFVTIGNTTVNGGDFTLSSGADNTQFLFALYFYPTLNNTEEILVDTTTNNSTAGWVVRKTSTNTIQLLLIAAGTPHTQVNITSTNPVTIGEWNFILYGSNSSNRNLIVNNTQTTLNVGGGFTSNTPNNGIRLGDRRGLVSSLTGAGFTGKMLYFMSAKTLAPGGSTTAPVVTNRDTQPPYNPVHTAGWSLNVLNTATEMTAMNSFPANRNTFIKSIGNGSSFLGAQNLVANSSISAINISGADCFYVNFGRNKARVGTIAIPFQLGVNLVNLVKYDTATNSAILSVWAATTLPGEVPSNANLTNPALWDKYELTITGINNAGSNSDISGLTTTTANGYRFITVNTGITKYYKYYRVGWKNAIVGASVSGINNISHFFFYNSDVISPDLDLIPPTASYSA